MIGVTGVSGSGKSTLINETLYPILNTHFLMPLKNKPYKSIKGIEHIDKVIDINQSPIGRTPRSNPATYTGVFGNRNLFAMTRKPSVTDINPDDLVLMFRADVVRLSQRRGITHN